MSKESKLINIEHLKVFNDLNDVVVNYKINNKINNVVGDLNSLTTEDKDNIVDAINELDYELANYEDINKIFNKMPGVIFTAKQANSTVGLNKKSTGHTLEYSTDCNTWYSMTSATTITLTNSGDSVFVRGVLSSNNTSSRYTNFKMSGDIKASGNINYIWDKNNPESAELKQYCGAYLFSGCTALSDASKLKLPAKTLANYCYYNMFKGCTSLTTAPSILPATTLANNCYSNMFQNCTSLTTAPTLPATTLANYCYSYMFYGCTSLTTAPVLSATALTDWCYSAMFRGCTSLTNAPELPAPTLVYYCYYQMFSGCTNLNYIKCLATNISEEGCTKNWVVGLAATGTFVKKTGMTGWTTGADGIPDGWTVQDA